MAVTVHNSSYTIRGITYAYGAKFVCYAANKGNGGSEGDGSSAAALSKGETYVFKGYATDDDNGGALTAYPFKIYTTGGGIRGWYKENVFPYATYSIKYNANGGSGAPSTQTKTYGTAIKISTTKPTRTGYTFQGWATSANGSVAYAAGATYSTNAALTLYAVWKANTYTVTYNANGGSGAPGNQTKTHGVTLTLSSTKPTRTNYIFKGWGTSASATTVAYAAGASYTGNAAITLYAVWELDYQKPRITNFSVSRCDSSGTISNDGTNALVNFSWATDKTVIGIIIAWKLSTESEYSESDVVTVSASGTSGNVSEIVGNDTLLATNTYDIQVSVGDGGINKATKTLTSQAFTIHAKPGGDGIAFGKAAELSGVSDIAFETLHRGGIRQLVLDNETDLDTVMTPNTYSGNAATTAGYLNCPITSGTSFVLEVMSAGDAGQLLQRITTCTKAKPFIYERFYYSGAWGEWLCISSFGNKVLWSGGSYMNSDQILTLSEAISAQPTGVVLAWSSYTSGTANNYNWNYFFVSKSHVSLHNGTGLYMTNPYVGMNKYIYIHDTTITGNAQNVGSSTVNGIAYNNNNYVLRYVIGV